MSRIIYTFAQKSFFTFTQKTLDILKIVILKVNKI